MRDRKRCRFCRCLYVPDARTAHRQRCCSKDECQVQRRAETQRRYRESHPGDAEARRYRAAVTASKAGQVPSLPSPVPAVMGRQWWSEVRDEMRPEVFVTLVFLARLLARRPKDEIQPQVSETTRESRKSVPDAVKDVTAEAVVPP